MWFNLHIVVNRVFLKVQSQHKPYQRKGVYAVDDIHGAMAMVNKVLFLGFGFGAHKFTSSNLPYNFAAWSWSQFTHSAAPSSCERVLDFSAYYPHREINRIDVIEWMT